MNDENGPKITQAESFMVLSTLAVLDVADMFLAPFTMGIPVVGIVEFPITQLYFRMRGVRGNYMLLSNMIGVLPFIGEAPMRTIGAAITIYIANHPESTLAEVEGAVASRMGRKLALTARRAERQAAHAEQTAGALNEKVKTQPHIAGEAQETQRKAEEARKKAEEAKEKMLRFQKIQTKAGKELGQPAVGNIIRPRFGAEDTTSEIAAEGQDAQAA